MSCEATEGRVVLSTDTTLELSSMGLHVVVQLSSDAEHPWTLLAFKEIACVYHHVSFQTGCVVGDKLTQAASSNELSVAAILLC